MAKQKPAPASDITAADLGGDLSVDPIPRAGGAPGGDDKPPPPFGTPEVAPAGGPYPRVCKELERAPKGVTRFKVRATNYSPRPTRYILALDEDSAREHYLKVEKLDVLVAKLKRQAGPKADDVEAPDLAVTVLSD